MGAALLLAVVWGVPADAARGAAPRAKAAITECTRDAVGVAGVVGKPRGARGARLLATVDLVSLFGAGRERASVEGTRRGLVEARFGDLAADTWWAFVRYRWVRGRRTVARGSVRTDAVRIGRRRGRAFCTLALGRGVRDTTPPQVFLEPTDSDWRRGPLEARFHAFDDHSGVRAVSYRVNGGELRSGRSVTLAEQGTYAIEYAAEDLAGNRSQVKTGVVRVDTAPPSAPVLTGPASTTGDTTPTITWQTSTDSGSGVVGYAVVVRDAAGQIAGFEQVAPNGEPTQGVALSSALADGDYTVEVHAVDGARPEPWTQASAPRSLRIASAPPHVTATDPPAGGVRTHAERSASVRVDFDRPVDPASLSASTVRVERSPADASVSFTVACASSPCTSVTATPSAAMEGAWTLTVSGVRAEDGTPVADHSASFRVRAYETAFDGGCGAFAASDPFTCSGGSLHTESPDRCGTIGGGTRTYSATTTALPVGPGGQPFELSLRYSLSGASGDAGRLLARVDGGAFEQLGGDLAAGSGTVTRTVPSAASSVTLRVDHVVAAQGAGGCSADPSASLSVDDVVLLRQP